MCLEWLGDVRGEKMNKEVLMSAALVVVLLVSVVQAVQLNTFKVNIDSGSLPLSSGSSKQVSSVPSAGGSATLPSNLQELPGMVGGC
jgi:hypothetical protein